jgi:predicted permease
MRTTWRRLIGLFAGRRSDLLLDEEVRAHLDLLTDEYVRRGMPVDQARLAARRAFGGVAQMKERYRDTRGLRWVEDAWRDTRYAVRMMRRDRVLASIAVMTLALGIGANTALFSVIDALLLRRLPVANPEELRLLTIHRPQAATPGFSFSYPLYEDVRTMADAFSGFLAVGSVNPMRLVVGGRDGSAATQAEVAITQGVSGTFFSVLGVKPAIGRVLDTADDDAKTPVGAVVVSEGFWARRFGRDPRVVGRPITINEVPFTIVGVAAPGFTGVQVGTDPDVWWPTRFLTRLINAPPMLFTERGNQSWRVIGRLAPGADDARAQAQVASIFQADVIQQMERRSRLGVRTTPREQREFVQQELRLESGAAGWTSLRWEFQRPLLILMIVVALVLLVACANVANLLLARAAVRRREMAVRMAIGSGRGRLVRQLVTESVLLGVTGGVLGLGVAFLGSRLIPSFMSAQDVTLVVGPDARVLSFTALVSLASALVFGLVPALTGTRLDLNAALNEHTRTVGVGRLRIHNAVVVAQVALSVIVLIGAGLFGRTLANLQRLDTGFERDSLAVASLQLPATYEPARRNAIYRGVMDALNGLPGMNASFSFFGLLSGNGWREQIVIPGYTPRPDEQMDALGMIVGPGFFEVTGVRVVLGRGLQLSDERSSVRVAVVNQTMARRFFGREPLGRRFTMPRQFRNETFEIVGVAEDATYRRMRQEAEDGLPNFYVPAFQAPGASMAGSLRNGQLQLRAAAPGATLETMIRNVAREVDPAVVVTDLRPMTALIDRNIAQERLLAQLATWLGALALALGAIGIYGVRSYTVNRRASEIGLRLALGATATHVFRLIVGQGVVVTALGIAIGLVSSAALTRYVSNLLFGVTPHDPVTFAGVAVVFVAVAVLASYAPARRAARLDPAAVLRTD